MWPRIVETMLACWLAVSPFVFRYSGDDPLLWWNAFACAALVACLSLASLAPRFDRLHFGVLAVAAWLAAPALAGIGSPPPAAPLQNQFLVALLLGMLAVLPTRSNRPPRPWLEQEEASRQIRGRAGKTGAPS